MIEGWKLLSECDGCGILHVSSAYFKEIFEFLWFCFELVSELTQRRDELFVGFEDYGYMHYCWETVVAWLTSVDVIIRMY